jgi:putative hydrolase of the HAD superfamily
MAAASDQKKFPSPEDLAGTDFVLLDFDNTFYEYEPCHLAAMAAVYARLVPETGWTEAEFLSRYQSSQQAVKTQIETSAASHSRLLYFQNLLEQAFGRTKVSLSLELEDIYWRAFLTSIRLCPEALSFVAACRAAGKKICLVTDLTTRIQFEKIKFLGLEDNIDLIVTSEEAGRDKPAPDIFTLALKKLGADPDRTVMVGDSPAKDRVGAESSGIRAFII